MQPLSCDGGCGGQAQIMITVIATGDVLALCMGCTADWGQAIAAQRDAALAAEQAASEPVEQVKEDLNASMAKRLGGSRPARRRRSSGSAAPFPSIVSGASTPADSAGHVDSVEHGPTTGPDIAGHNADDIATVE